MKHIPIAAVTTLVAMLSTSTLAATMTETYTFTGIGNGIFTSVEMDGDQGNTVRVTPGTYPVFTYDYSTDADDRVARGLTWGLGMYSSEPYNTSENEHRVAGTPSNEILIFEFLDYSATITSITFGNTRGSDFDLFGSDTPTEESAFLPLSNGTVDVSAENRSGTIIGIGAFSETSAFKVRSLTVEYHEPDPIPLPAAGWLLLAGIGGLGVMKRRSRKSS